MARRSPNALHLLSAREVQNAATGDHSDGGGLILRADSERNAASWVYRYTSPTGRRREMGLGPCLRGSLKQAADSLTSARDLAHEARELVRRGNDPLDERDRKKEAARLEVSERKQSEEKNRWTLIRCCRDYHERVIEKNRKAKHAAQWIASLENHLPASLKNQPIDSITPPALLAALDAASAHERARRAGDLSETLRRIRQRLDSVFEDAIFFGRCSTNPAGGIKRKLTEARPVRGKASLTFLDYHEAPELMARIKAMPGTSARCLEFAVLTASRTSEALLAEWGEFNLEERVWVIPAARMKREEEHTVYLSQPVVNILRGQVGQDARYVFPSTHKNKEGKPQSNMALLATLGRLGMRDKTTVHGLCRATFSTWANETGVARPDVIEAALAHSEANLVRRAYNHAAFTAERRALLDAWAGYLTRPKVVALAA